MTPTGSQRPRSTIQNQNQSGAILSPGGQLDERHLELQPAPASRPESDTESDGSRSNGQPSPPSRSESDTESDGSSWGGESSTASRPESDTESDGLRWSGQPSPASMPPGDGLSQGDDLPAGDGLSQGDDLSQGDHLGDHLPAGDDLLPQTPDDPMAGTIDLTLTDASETDKPEGCAGAARPHPRGVNPNPMRQCPTR